MRKITLLVFLVMFSCLAFATEYTANNSVELAGYLTSTTDGDVINLAAGTYYPPEVTMSFADYWMDPSPTEGEGSIYSVTFNAFVIPEKDITISGASTSAVIFDRNSVDDNDWQMAFVFFSDGDAVDETGITFENFTVQNLDYGLVNTWVLTQNYITSPTSSYMEYTHIENINFNDIAESAIVIEPKFCCASKGANNVDLFSRTNYDWMSLADHPSSFAGGYAETASRCEIYSCDFNIYGVNPKADNFNKTMISDVAVMVDLNGCQFTSGWRGFHMYGGNTGDVYGDLTMLITSCSFMDFDGAAYPGITANDNPSTNPEYIYNEEYYNGRGFGAYYQGSTFSAEFYGNDYAASNGSSAVHTDGLDSETSSYETFNYIGSSGWVKDLHNIKTQVTVENSTFYIFDEGLGIIITKHGDTNRATNGVNPSDAENYNYDNSYGTLNQPVLINNCNFIGVNTGNPTYPGNGCAIFLADWEHYDRDAWGVSDPFRQSEIAMRIDGCLFQGFDAGIFVDGGRPDNLYAVDYGTPTTRWAKHDDGRIQLYVENSKFVSCNYSLDFSYWDQWVRTNSWILLENNYYGADVDPYTTFNLADDFPAEDSFYELDYSGVWSDATTQTGYTYGQGATQRSYPGEDPESDDNYHVYQPQFLQYLPYYRDFEMTQLVSVEVENLTVSRSGTDYILDWDDNINPVAKYAVYAADDPYTDDWGAAVATVETSTYTYDGTGLTEKYFMVAIVIPNMVDEFYGTNLLDGYGDSVPTYTEPIDFGFDTVVNSGVSDYGIIDFVYADDATYNVAKAGFMKKTLDYTGTHFNLISLPFAGEYGTVAELATYLGLTTADAISAWHEATQGWQSATYAGGLWDEAYVPVINQPYMVTAGSAHDIYMMGAIPASPTYNLITTSTTDLNFIMIPLDCELATAAELGAQMGQNNAVMISQWDAANQSWQSCVYLETFSAWINSFSIDPGMPIVIGVEQNFTWPQ
ncbi:MAG: hypothetical protein K9M99_11635 [Candidatus Cloacimonetes bacterium]|nr:hypothetical protein [Candidatus Cloacimonadota bacterium]